MVTHKEVFSLKSIHCLSCAYLLIFTSWFVIFSKENVYNRIIFLTIYSHSREQKIKKKSSIPVALFFAILCKTILITYLHCKENLYAKMCFFKGPKIWVGRRSCFFSVPIHITKHWKIAKTKINSITLLYNPTSKWTKNKFKESYEPIKNFVKPTKIYKFLFALELIVR